MYPMNMQLAIIAARLEAKSVDNESLFRANAELTVLNSKLQKKIDKLKVKTNEHISKSNQSVTKKIDFNFSFQNEFAKIIITEKQKAVVLFKVKINKEILLKKINCNSSKFNLNQNDWNWDETINKVKQFFFFII